MSHMDGFPEVLPCRDRFITKFFLSAGPTMSPDYMVTVVDGKGGRLRLWRPGNDVWTVVNCPGPERDIWDVIFYEGCFVAVDCEGSISRYDVNGGRLRSKLE
ncbi:hypothetical protein ACJRO7_029867 [Eucalyptus globulus]|uniref:KIB1-4 beta-propeller domain-containing protein n=1 Tax=Eucalyptus globulus TaxID=34317 RepID=A0ABD3J9V5_EUCGL